MVPYPNRVRTVLTSRSAAQPPQFSDVASATCTPVADALPCSMPERSHSGTSTTH